MIEDEPQRVPLTSPPDDEVLEDIGVIPRDVDVIPADVGVESEASGPAEDRFLPWAKVEELAGISRTTAWREQKRGAFPAPVVLSRGRVGWRESEVAAWKAARPQSSTLMGPARHISVEPQPEPTRCGAPAQESFPSGAWEAPGLD